VRDAQAQLTKASLKVIGISPDSPDQQKTFEKKENLNFPLLSDLDHAVAQAYGVWGEKNMYGKKFQGIIRSSFLIDEKGKILQAWYKISPADTVPKALEALAS
jgi:thioredoxin-dependent peroxiredoxin